MMNRSICLAVVIACGCALPARAEEKTKPVRMGCGLMTFDTVPGWGLSPEGKSVIGPCHGSVVVDAAVGGINVLVTAAVMVSVGDAVGVPVLVGTVVVANVVIEGVGENVLVGEMAGVLDGVAVMPEGRTANRPISAQPPLQSAP